MTAMIVSAARRAPSAPGFSSTATMSGDRTPPARTAGGAGGGRRPGPMADAANGPDEAPDHYLVDQEMLTRIAEYEWAIVPQDRRATFSVQDWQKAIFNRCAGPLKRAEDRLEENFISEKLFIARVRILRQTFAQQVHRAMRTVADKYNAQ